MIENFLEELTITVRENKSLRIENEILRLKVAMYKAYFFGKHELADQLRDQASENRDNQIGEFDGFCYSSKRANAQFKTLEDMAAEGAITKDQYAFCVERF